MQERLTAPPLPMNTHWIASLVTGGTGSFTMTKEKVTWSPMLIGLLVTLSKGTTSGGTVEFRYVQLVIQTESIECSHETDWPTLGIALAPVHGKKTSAMFSVFARAMLPYISHLPML